MKTTVGAKVNNGEIIVIGDLQEDNVTIRANRNVNLFINEESCISGKIYRVTSSDKITYTCEKQLSKKEANVIVSDDKMKAFIVIEYEPEIEYKIKERELFINLALATEVSSKTEPEHFTLEEIYKILKDKGIVYGIKEEALKNALNGCKDKVLIAEGDYPVDDVQSEIKPLFMPSQMMMPDPESNEKIDYKNLFRISNVMAGDKIAEIVPEYIGKDGKNIFGKVIKKQYVRKIPISINNGCKIEGNNIIAMIDGKAHQVNRSIGVNPVYRVETINMETCNIKFYGDIEVYSSIEDNMSISAGGSLDVSQNVNTSDVVTGGEINILGNAINSKILCGQVDIVKKEYSDVLNKFKDIVIKIIEILNNPKFENINLGIGELIRQIIELKFKDFQKLSLNIVSLNIKNKIKDNRLVDFLKEKILGLNLLKIKSIEELITLVSMLDNEIDYYDKHTIVPLDIRISYCQECEVKSTGNIIISGKGEYISNLNAMKDIIFTKSESVARGGNLSAGGNISAGIIGSPGYVTTTLKVTKYGTISATLAYKNTVFCFDNLKMTLDETLENIYVYFDKDTRKIEIAKSALS